MLVLYLEVVLHRRSTALCAKVWNLLLKYSYQCSLKRAREYIKREAQQEMEVDSGNKFSKKVDIGSAGRVTWRFFSASLRVQEIAIG